MWFALDFWPYYASNGFDVQALDYTEIGAWARLKKVEPTPFEVDLLLRFDAEFRTSLNKKNKSKFGSSSSKSDDIPKDNVQGVRAMMQGFAIRAKEIFGKKEAEKK